MPYIKTPAFCPEQNTGVFLVSKGNEKRRAVQRSAHNGRSPNETIMIKEACCHAG